MNGNASAAEVVKIEIGRLLTEEPGKRRKDLQGLVRDPLLLVRRHAAQCAQVVQPVGQLDEDDADLLRHGQEELLQVHGLDVHVGVPLGQPADLAELRLALHYPPHVVPKQLLNVFECDLVGVFHAVVQ
eukprot:scaffold223467_cov49-Prasinocladus_malaysianus.AAC.6